MGSTAVLAATALERRAPPDGFEQPTAAQPAATLRRCTVAPG